MFQDKERGTAIVEFALVVPLLLTVLFGIIEFSILFYDKAVITNASREAAREGILFKTPKPTLGDLQTVVNNYTQNRMIAVSAVAPPNVTTNVDPTTLTSGQYLAVTVEYDYTFAFLPGFVSDLLPTIQLDARTTMRAE